MSEGAGPASYDERRRAADDMTSDAEIAIERAARAWDAIGHHEFGERCRDAARHLPERWERRP